MYFNIKSRLFYLILGMIIFIIAYSIGALTDISKDEAEKLRQQFDKQEMKNIDRNAIFINNLRISIVMFTPAIGVGFGTYTGFSTGFTSNAIAETYPNLSSISTFQNLVKPFGILEIFCYGLAMSKSWIIIHQILKRKKFKEIVIPIFIEIGIVIAVLFVAATIEWNTITAFK